MSRRGTLWISRSEHVEALGPCAVRELASSLDVGADSLSYHVRRLQQIGTCVASTAISPGS